MRYTRSIQVFVLIALLTGSLAGVRAQTVPVDNAPGFTRDAAILRTAYEALHPGLYRYATPDRVNARFATLDAALARDRDLRAAFVDLSRFAASIECGHTYPNFFNQPDDVARQLFQHQDKVPFYFTWIGRRMIVTRNFSTDAALTPGTEVESIDGLPAAKILATLMPLVSADGSNDAKRVEELAVRGAGTYEAFDVYFPMVYPRRSTTMTLRLRSITGSERTTIVTALTYRERVAPIEATVAAERGGSSPLWKFGFIDAHTAYLTMPTWDVYDSKWNWKQFLDDAFVELDQKKPARFIVDIRGNEGGSDVGQQLLAHLVSSPIQLDAYRRLVRYRSVPADLRPYLSTWDASFYDLGRTAPAEDARFYRLTNVADDPEIVRPVAPRYSGMVYVLVDASNSSATFNFDRAVRERRLGTLVGMPTGGNLRGINGGAFFFLSLPYSHIELDLPLIGTFPAQSQPDAGIVPDVVVQTLPADIAAGIDPALTAVLHRKMPTYVPLSAPI